MSTDNSPPPLPASPRSFHALPHHPAPPTPSPSPSPPATICSRLSNGSQSAPSPTNSRGSFHGISFLLQIGLTREAVTLDPGDVSLSSVRELVCSIVDQKVKPKVFFFCTLSSFFFFFYPQPYSRSLENLTGTSHLQDSKKFTSHIHPFSCIEMRLSTLASLCPPHPTLRGSVPHNFLFTFHINLLVKGRSSDTGWP